MAKEKMGFWVQLGKRQAMWRTEDGEIRLSNLPDDQGNIRSTAFIANEDTVHLPFVLRSIDMGVLVRLTEAPKSSVTKAPKIENLTNKRDDEIINANKAKQLLRLSTESFNRTLETIVDDNLLRQAILLESSGKNKAGKKREVVLQALRERLEEVGGMADDPKNRPSSLGGIVDYVEDEGILSNTKKQ